MFPLPEQYKNAVTQRFGEPNEHYKSGIHMGTDYACPVGTPIYAPEDGQVYYRFFDHPSLGYAIYFRTENHHIRFLHLSDVLRTGNYKKGDVIGYTGDTGDSKGAHLHVDVWSVPINSRLLYTKSSVLSNLVDPETYFKQS